MPRQKSLWVDLQSSTELALQFSTTFDWQALAAQASQKLERLASGSGGSFSTLQPKGRVKAKKARAISGFFIEGWTIHRAIVFGHLRGEGGSARLADVPGLAVPRISRRPSAPPPRIPSPLQAGLLWLFAMV